MPLLLDFRWAEIGVRSSLANVAAVLCDPELADQVNPVTQAFKWTESGTQFTCFTGTKVQILTPEVRARFMWAIANVSLIVYGNRLMLYS